MAKTIYITTPIYYVNAAPHIGHSYTTIAADALARMHRLAGNSVFLLTGTDEHGHKIEQAAAAAGQTPQAFVDAIAPRFQSLWKLLDIQYDDFIRTTQKRHIERVQIILDRLHKAGRLKREAYQGWYCTPDETFWTQAELAAASEASSPVCPTCQRPLEPVQEVGWHLKLREHQEWLREYVRSHPAFIRPEGRYNELFSLLQQPLPESLCITRPRQRVGWGITAPFDPECVIYVWFDALLNYFTIPWVLREEKGVQLWPATVHLIGKDILRHHALYWPIILHEMAGLVPEAGFDKDVPMPELIFAHGWWKIGEQKMSKSLGNIVDPSVVVTQFLKDQPYAADVYRYFILREVPFGQDGAFSEDAILTRLNNDLGNDLGNLVNRTLSMIDRYCGGKIPACLPKDQLDAIGGQRALADAALALPEVVNRFTQQLELSMALEAIMRVVSQANQFIEQSAPWKLAKQPDARGQLDQVLAVLAETIRIVTILLGPFMPSVGEEILKQFGCQAGKRALTDAAVWPGLAPDQAVAESHPVLFPRPKL